MSHVSRLTKASDNFEDVSFTQRHAVLLPKRHHCTEPVLDHFRRKNLHSGHHRSWPHDVQCAICNVQICSLRPLIQNFSNERLNGSSSLMARWIGPGLTSFFAFYLKRIALSAENALLIVF